MDLNEEIVSISWCIEDIKWSFEDNNIAFTAENIEKLLDTRLVKTLYDCLISQGWEIIQNAIYECKDELERIEGEYDDNKEWVEEKDC